MPAAIFCLRDRTTTSDLDESDAIQILSTSKNSEFSASPLITHAKLRLENGKTFDAYAWTGAVDKRVSVIFMLHNPCANNAVMGANSNGVSRTFEVLLDAATEGSSGPFRIVNMNPVVYDGVGVPSMRAMFEAACFDSISNALLFGVRVIVAYGDAVCKRWQTLGPQDSLYSQKAKRRINIKCVNSTTSHHLITYCVSDIRTSPKFRVQYQVLVVFAPHPSCSKSRDICAQVTRKVCALVAAHAGGPVRALASDYAQSDAALSYVQWRNPCRSPLPDDSCATASAAADTPEGAYDRRIAAAAGPSSGL
jgi:hypothetical protein